MKKDIWDNVYYRLKDEHEVKLSILYAVKYADIPVSDTEIKHFMLTATTVTLVDLCINLDALVSDGFLKLVWRDETEKYELTSLGNELIDMFSDKILLTVRENIRLTVDGYFKRDTSKPQIRCSIAPAAGDNFNVELEIKNSKNKLISLSLFAGNREAAISMRKHFESSAWDIYTKITEIATACDEKEEK